MKYTAILLAALALLAGCTTTVTHPTKRTAEFNADSYECDKDTAAVQNHTRMVEMHRACMLNKGWRPG